MPRKKKEEVVVEEPVVEKTMTKDFDIYKPLIEMGKVPQRRSLLTNSRSKYFNSTIAKRRAKEKNRRKANRITRSR